MKKRILKNESPKEEIMWEVGRNIQRIRKSFHNYPSVESVAKKIGLNRVTLTQIENGKKNINAIVLWKLACVFACDINDFFPPIPKGFQMSRGDVEKIEKIDKRAAKWAEELFGKPVNKKII
jgi:DNA-binding XRE family transcriptional regulator